MNHTKRYGLFLALAILLAIIGLGGSANAGQLVQGRPNHYNNLAPALGGISPAGVWSNFDGHNCDGAFMQGSLYNRPFLRIHRSSPSNQCAFIGGRVVGVVNGGLWGTPTSPNTYCGFISGTFSACTILPDGTGDLWIQQSVEGPFLGTEMYVCDSSYSHGDSSLSYNAVDCKEFTTSL